MCTPVNVQVNIKLTVFEWRFRLYLLDLQLSLQQLLSGQLHGEVSPGEEHRVPVQPLSRAGLCGLSAAAFPRTSAVTAAGAEGDSRVVVVVVEEAAGPL